MKILTVDSPSLLRRFIDLPYRLYKNHPYWVPPLRVDVKAQLSPKKHPFYRHADHAFYLATANGQDLGRIAVFHNRKHNQVYEVNAGMFGYLDMIDDVDVTAALMETARKWLQPYGATEILGPFNPDINGTMGILMDSFDSPPMIMLTYNYPYYAEHLEQLGLEKRKDVWTYELRAPVPIPPRVTEHVKKFEAEGRFSIRKMNMKRFWDEVELVKEIYNQAWAENWGALWMDDEEFHHIAKDLKLILDPNMVYIAEVDGQVAGFSLSLPNINEALKHLPNGRLLPFGIVKLLRHRRKISSLRIFTLGVLKPYRRLAIDAAFYLRTIEIGQSRGYYYGEASWILEDNAPMNHALIKMGGKKAKTYRIYAQELDGASEPSPSPVESPG